MGQALARAAEWTSAASGGRGKLALTPINEKLIREIVEFTEAIPSRHSECGSIEFQKPIVYSSYLDASVFGGSGGSFESSEKSKDGSASLLSVMGGKISIGSLPMLLKVLQSSGDSKMKEARLILEENSDPAANILGATYATTGGDDNTLARLIEQSKTDEDESQRAILRLYIAFNNLDMELMKVSLQEFSQGFRLTPEVVGNEVDLLQRYTSSKYGKLLERIVYTSNIVFKNGCRAPYLRQLEGEICYLEILTLEQNEICVTASTSGYFENAGFNRETVEPTYERKGEIYKDLKSLLKDASAKFASNLASKEFASESGKDAKKGERRHSSDSEGDLKGRRTQDKRADQDRDQEKKRRVQREKTKKKRKEVSIPWKTLEMSDDEEQEGGGAPGNEGGKKREIKRNKEDTVDAKEKPKKSPEKKKATMESARQKSFTGKPRTPMTHKDSDYSDSSSESEEEEEAPDRRQESGSADLPPEYWQIQKLVKYLKGGNQTATIIALCCLRDFNLSQETCQLAIRNVGGLEVLLNLLDTEDVKCKIGALKILKEISRNVQIRKSIAELGGLQTMVNILKSPNKDLKCLAAETIANVAKFRRARRVVRQYGGIRKLVALMDNAPVGKSGDNEELAKDIEVARCGALALWSCSKSTKNKRAIGKAGAIPLLAKLLKSEHESMLVPVIGTLQECASESNYRLAIRTQGMIEDLVANLKSDNIELRMHCASAIFKCAEDEETRNLVRKFNGLQPLVDLLDQSDNKELLAAATGAIWKCAISEENVKMFQKMGVIERLVYLLDDQPEEVLINVVGALSECAKSEENRNTIRNKNGIPPLISQLTGTNHALLVNTTNAIGACARDKESMPIIDNYDGVRLLWSLLKNNNWQVEASAAWAICPCIMNHREAGEMVRSFVGGLELIVNLLRSEHFEVLAAVCAAIAQIAKDEENLAVITDHNVVPMLSSLTSTKDDLLRRHLAEAIARCCKWGSNRRTFGEKDAVAPLVHYLGSKDEEVHWATTLALNQLSQDPDNCITMHREGVVKVLMEMVGSKNYDLQENAAQCLGNIRRLAMCNEKAKYK